jgi:hypothetical protein
MKATRKVGVKKRRAAFVENEVSRWNRPAPIRKQCEDLLEQMRTYLAHVDEMSLLEWARAVYLRYATREGIAADYAAISSIDDIYRFLDRHDCPVVEDDLDIAELKRVEREGLDWKGNTK